MYPIAIPWFLPLLLPKILWQDPAEKGKNLYLTFDDGPTEELCPWILDQLAYYDAKASFFCVGQNVIHNPLLFEKIKALGHTIGNHSHHHLNGWNTKTDEYLADIQKCHKWTQSPFYRPPYGKLTLRQYRILSKSYKIVYWSILPGDFDQSIDPEVCWNRLKKNLHPGAVVVLHDNLKAADNMKYTLDQCLKWGTENGYTFKNIESLLH